MFEAPAEEIADFAARARSATCCNMCLRFLTCLHEHTHSGCFLQANLGKAGREFAVFVECVDGVTGCAQGFRQ